MKSISILLDIDFLQGEIMKILEELFYGNLDESTRKMGEYLKNKRQKEVELIDEIMSLLPEKERPKFEKLMIMIDDNYFDELKDKYIQGVKTGILIGVESSQIEL